MTLRIEPCPYCGKRFNGDHRRKEASESVAPPKCEACADFGGQLPSDQCRHPIIDAEHERGRDLGDPCRQCIEGAARLFRAVRDQKFHPEIESRGMVQEEED